MSSEVRLDEGRLVSNKSLIPAPIPTLTLINSIKLEFQTMS